MTESSNTSGIGRRRILQNGAAITGGLVAGGAFAGSALEDERGGRGQGGVGFMSVSSFGKLVGNDETTCIESDEQWDGTFYIRREAKNEDDDEGVFIDVPPSCSGSDSAQPFRGYLVTAGEDTVCQGGPNGNGPWVQKPCTWLFVNRNRNVRFGIEQRITKVHGPEPPAACHEGAQPRDNGDSDVGAPFDVVRLTFAPAQEGDGNGPPS